LKAWFSSDKIAAWLPFLMLFLVFPLALTLHNQEELSHPLGHYLVIYFSFAIVSYLLLVLLLRYLLPTSSKELISVLMFLLGMFILISDIVAPLRLDSFDDLSGIGKIKVLPLDFIFEFFVGIALLFCLRVKRDWLFKIGSIITIYFFVSQVAVWAHAVSTKDDAPENKDLAQQLKGNTTVESKGNIYHFIFDTYGPGFLEHLSAIKGAQESFNGFVYFKKNLTNSDYTQISVPIIWSGHTFLDSDLSISAWRQTGFMSQGPLVDFHKSGYTIYEYQTKYRHRLADHTVHGNDLKAKIFEIGDDEFGPWNIMDLSILRAAPTFLQNYIFYKGDGPLSNLRFAFAKTKKLSGNFVRAPLAVAVLQKFLAEEPSRSNSGNYVLAHISLPHDPYVVTRKCTTNFTATTYDDQAICAVRFMVEIIKTLKAEGRYEDSTIIFQGDHGPVLSKRERKQKGIVFLKGPKTLLLIKPPNSSDLPMEISEIQSQSLDIAPTLYALTGVSHDQKMELAGENLFSNHVNKSREIHIYSYRRPYNNRTEELMHWSFVDGIGFKKYQNILPKM